MKVAIFLIGLFIAAPPDIYDRVFYCTYQNDECVESSNPIQVDGSEIGELLERVGRMKTNFVGFVDEDGTALQFFVDDIDEIWVEIPIPSQKGSYGAKIDQSQMQEIVQDLAAPFIDYKTKLDMSFEAW